MWYHMQITNIYVFTKMKNNKIRKIIISKTRKIRIKKLENLKRIYFYVSKCELET